jgi:hypothetical protein
MSEPRTFEVRIDGAVTAAQVATVLSRGGLDESYYDVEEVER